MGYSIYYDRAFIRIADKFIPVVQSGASNCADYVKGRLVAEKNWEVLNWRRSDRVLFSEAEIREIAKDYERNSQESGMSFKSRNKPFAPGEFERWIIGGMKRACTIEDYASFGNKLFVVDFPEGRVNRWRTQPFHTSEQMLSIISEFKDSKEFDISFSNREVIHPTARRKQERIDRANMYSGSSSVCGSAASAGEQPEVGKPSVLGRIAESRAQTATEEKPKQSKHNKSRDAETSQKQRGGAVTDER